jgi:hypothetical protein
VIIKEDLIRCYLERRPGPHRIARIRAHIQIQLINKTQRVSSPYALIALIVRTGYLVY